MEMRDILLFTQCAGIFGLFVESLIVFRTWKGKLHSYLFFSCVAALVNNLGYLFEMLADSEKEYIVALKLSYAGRIWFAFALFLFVAELTEINFPYLLRRIFCVIHAGTYVSVLALEYNSLFYRTYSYEFIDIFPKLRHSYGVLYYVQMALMLFYIFGGITMVIIALRREKRKSTKKRLAIVLLAICVPGSTYVIQVVGINGLPHSYDITMLGYFVSTILMLIAIFTLDLLGTKEIARDFVVDRISEGIIAVDNEYAIQFFNEPAANLYPVLTKKDADVEKQKVLEDIRSAILTGDTIQINERIYMPEENALTHGGADYGKLYALVDETEHYRYMEELRKQTQIADMANKAKGRFLANMSHEIRTPINAILGMDEMVLRESGEPEIRAYATDIMGAGKSLLSLINNILDLSSVEDGKLEINPIQYELSSLINDLVNMTQNRIKKKGLRLCIHVDEEIPHLLYGDELRLRQCVLNLINNSINYTEEGSIILNVGYRESDDEHILLRISVEDTGVGLTPEEVEMLFDPGKWIDDSWDQSMEAAALGLNISSQLLGLMGSKLDFESEYGKGTIASFAVSQKVIKWDKIGDYEKRFRANQSVGAIYRELFHAPDARILVVDDTEMNLAVIKRLLKQTKIRIDTASSGKEALAYAEREKYDVIFIDHMMPVMDGIETLRRMREIELNKDTPKVALTANAVAGSREKYLSLGFDNYLPKPVDGDRLEQELRKMLPSEKILAPEDLNSVENITPTKPKILAVDDDTSVCALIREILGEEYDVETETEGTETVKHAKAFSPDLIVLDIHLADCDGFEIMKKLRKDLRTSDIPVLLITGDDADIMEEHGFKNGAADYIRKPFVPDVLRQRAKRIIDLHHYQRSIEREVARQANRSRRLSREMMLALSKTVDTKDHYTDGHSRRVAAYCAEIARRLGMTAAEQVELYEIGLLHDIGKIGIRDDIIRKDSGLTDDEFAIIKKHTIKGHEILKEITDMPRLSEGARWHHERFDGSGYPDHLKGEEIPLAARITCIADCYDAMTSTRTYSVPKPQEDVRKEIVRCRGTWFDPNIADVLLEMIDEDVDYRMNEKTDGNSIWQEYDRLWSTENRSAPEEDEKSSSDLPDWLYDIPEIDPLVGRKNCGSVDGYLSVLSIFHQTAEAKATEIEDFYTAGDISNYTIRVHALKSSARIIGANDLSKAAEKLEHAGKRGDTEFIKEKTEDLLNAYRSLDRELSALDKNKDELPLIDADALHDAYQTIVEIAGAMDYQLMEELLKSLKDYRFLPDDEATIKAIETGLTKLDWDSIESLAKEKL